ncbi:hypothetical protein ACFWGC_22830 [Cytobacillus pseudoceanisediminis]
MTNHAGNLPKQLWSGDVSDDEAFLVLISGVIWLMTRGARRWR